MIERAERYYQVSGERLKTLAKAGRARAERYGGFRLYTLTYQGKDVAGNTTNCQATARVPKAG